MIPKHFYTITLSILLAFSEAVFAQSRSVNRDDAFSVALAAYRAGDPIRLSRAAAALEGSVLLPYAEYWQLKLRLDEMPSTEVRAYLARYPGSYLADRLRADWLKELGKRRDWQTFDLELAPLLVDDSDIRCYTLASRLARGDASALDEANQFWLEPRELPEGCAVVAEASIAANKLNTNHVWQRVRILLDAGLLSPARRTMEYLPVAERPDERQLALAATNPASLLAKIPDDLTRRLKNSVRDRVSIRVRSRERTRL